MKLIIAGGRDIEVTNDFISTVLDEVGWKPVEIVSGACGRPEHEVEVLTNEHGRYIYADGVDGCGERFAMEGGAERLIRFPAKWSVLGRSAGPKRNKEMADYADALLLIWNGMSAGSASMRRFARFAGKPVLEIVLPRRENETDTRTEFTAIGV